MSKLIRLSGNVFGDPHITTLSGVRYTFNGLGEYWLVRTENNTRNVSLQVQCHTDRAEDSVTGIPNNATIFTAFAFTGCCTVPIIEVTHNCLSFNVKLRWLCQSRANLG